MKIWEKLTLTFLLILGYGLMFILSINSIYQGLIVGQVERVKFNLVVGAILLLFGLVFYRWILKIYDRKLQAIATAEELGKKPETNLVFVRILKLGEVMIPLIAIAFIFKGLTDVNITIPPSIVVRDILIWVGIGFIVLIFHDILKTHFRNKAEIRDSIKLDQRKEKILNKQMKHSRK